MKVRTLVSWCMSIFGAAFWIQAIFTAGSWTIYYVKNVILAGGPFLNLSNQSIMSYNTMVGVLSILSLLVGWTLMDVGRRLR